MWVEIDVFRSEAEFDKGMFLMNDILADGNSWPFREEFKTMEAYKSYFCSHGAFCVRLITSHFFPSQPEEGRDSQLEKYYHKVLDYKRQKYRGKSEEMDEFTKVIGCFYVKPNFPGRCDHFCNGGFITDKLYQKLGIGTFMAKNYLMLAKKLGYEASYFNLVFNTNEASHRLWKKLDFTPLATIPKVGRLLNHETGEDEYVDAVQYYKKL